MKTLGIDFEPLGKPANRHVETVSATIVFICMTTLFGIGYSLTLILIFTPFSIVALIYFAWIWIDIPTTQKGGRPSDWVRGWKLFKYAAEYYPVNLRVAPDLKLDPKKNYLFCGYPHAIFPSGIAISLTTKACGVDQVFPNHKMFTGTLDVNLKAPLYRDFLMSIGMCSVSANSLNYILDYPDGGRIALIIIGGASEAYLSRPGDYKIVLKNRMGFVKLAMKNGAPLVPIYSFGEIDAFNQYIPPENSLLQRLQNWLKNVTSIAFPVFWGSGIFQKSFGWAPHRRPINVVVGKPIDVGKYENPTKEEIAYYHNLFMDEMVKLFEEHKHLYIDDASDKHLIIV